MEVRSVTAAEFFTDVFPNLVDRHGALVVRGIRTLEARPLAIEIGTDTSSLVYDSGRLAALHGVARGAVVVMLTGEQLAQQLRTLAAMTVARELRHRDATEYDRPSGTPVAGAARELASRRRRHRTP